MRIWLTIFLIGLGIVAARAISPGEQIIIFGGNASSASGSSGGLDPAKIVNAAIPHMKAIARLQP